MTYRERKQFELVLGLVGLVIGLLIAAQADWHRVEWAWPRGTDLQSADGPPPRARVSSETSPWVMPEEMGP